MGLFGYQFSSFKESRNQISIQKGVERIYSIPTHLFNGQFEFNGNTIPRKTFRIPITSHSFIAIPHCFSVLSKYMKIKYNVLLQPVYKKKICYHIDCGQSI